MPRRAVESAGPWTARADRGHVHHQATVKPPAIHPACPPALDNPHGGCPHFPQPRRPIGETLDPNPPPASPFARIAPTGLQVVPSFWPRAGPMFVTSDTGAQVGEHPRKTSRIQSILTCE